MALALFAGHLHVPLFQNFLLEHGNMIRYDVKCRARNTKALRYRYDIGLDQYWIVDHEQMWQ